MDCPVAGVAGRSAQSKLGPGIKIDDSINNPPAQLAKHWPGSKAAMLFERARRQAQVHGSIGRADKAGRNWDIRGIHRQAPRSIGQAGPVPPNAEGYGAEEKCRGSDRLSGGTIDTPPGARLSDKAGEAPESAVDHARRVGDEAPGLALLVRSPPVLARKSRRVWKDDAKGNVAHGRADGNGIGDGE